MPFQILYLVQYFELTLEIVYVGKYAVVPGRLLGGNGCLPGDKLKRARQCKRDGSTEQATRLHKATFAGQCQITLSQNIQKYKKINFIFFKAMSFVPEKRNLITVELKRTHILS